MTLFCWVPTEAVEVESVEAPVKTRREGRRGAVLTEDLNGTKDGGYGDETKLRRDVAGLRVCGDRNWIGCAVVVIVGCPREADAVEGAVGIVLGRKDFEKLDEGKLFGDVVCGDA